MKAVVIETDSHLAPWQRTHKGLTWRDMGGTDEMAQKVNFSLFRRGLYDPAVDVVTGEAAEALLREVPQGRLATKGGVLVKKRRPRTGYGSSQPGVVRNKNRGKAPPKDVKAQALNARREALRVLQVDLLEWLSVPGRHLHQMVVIAGHKKTLRTLAAGKIPTPERLPVDFEIRVRAGMAAAVAAEKKKAAAERGRAALQAWCQRAVAQVLRRRPEMSATLLARMAGVSATGLLDVHRGRRQVMLATLQRIEKCLLRRFAADLPKVTLGMERRAA